MPILLLPDSEQGQLNKVRLMIRTLLSSGPKTTVEVEQALSQYVSPERISLVIGEMVTRGQLSQSTNTPAEGDSK
jgi:hypothetical protein